MCRKKNDFWNNFIQQPEPALDKHKESRPKPSARPGQSRVAGIALKEQKFLDGRTKHKHKHQNLWRTQVYSAHSFIFNFNVQPGAVLLLVLCALLSYAPYIIF